MTRDQITDDGLTQRQRGYVHARLRGLNQMDSAAAAGYRGSKATLKSAASALERHPKVRRCLDAGLKRVADESDERPAVELPQPQEGPQEAFANCTADIAIFGGGAGPGKSWSLLFDPVKWLEERDGVWRLPDGFRSVIFRRSSQDLIGGGGLWDESQKIYRGLGGRARSSPALDWIFPDNARIELRHLQHEEDVYSHHGRQYTYIGFDELQTFTARQFWYLMSRARSTCGVKPYIRATCNPDPDSFIFALVRWWIGDDGYPLLERSGKLRWFVRRDDVTHWYDSRDEAFAVHQIEPVSLTFIPAKLSDNKVLAEGDPSYRTKLLNMSHVDRERLLGDETRGGNWLVRPTAGSVLPRRCFKRANGPPSRVVKTVRAWDKAGTAPNPRNNDPDWTRGVRVSLCEDGEYWIDHLVSLRDRPAVVLRKMRETAELDGVGVTVMLWQDLGGAGLVDLDTTKGALSGFRVETVSAAAGVVPGQSGRGKAKYQHAKAWAKDLEDGRVHVLAGAPWADVLVAECDAFPDGRHDDIVDAISGAYQALARSRATSLIDAMMKVTGLPR